MLLVLGFSFQYRGLCDLPWPFPPKLLLIYCWPVLILRLFLLQLLTNKCKCFCYFCSSDFLSTLSVSFLSIWYIWAFLYRKSVFLYLKFLISVLVLLTEEFIPLFNLSVSSCEEVPTLSIHIRIIQTFHHVPSLVSFAIPVGKTISQWVARLL